MTITAGLRSGLVSGLRSGLNPGGSDPFAGVDRDATSGLYYPSDATQWNTFRSAGSLATANPTSLYLLQEASGNPADTLGAFPLTAGGTPLYQQAATGHTRKAIRSSADGNTASLSTADAALPDILTASCFAYAIIDMPTANPAAVRNFLMFGTNATRMAAQFTTLSKVHATAAGTTVTGTAVPTSRVMPIAIKVDRTGSINKVCTDQEVLAPAFNAALAGKRFNLLAVAGGQAAALCGYLYAARWDGAAAEAFTDAEVKKLFQTHGFTVPW